MIKQEFLERFNKKTLQPLSRGFCEFDGKKYYCLTNDGSYRHEFVNCDSFTYYVFLKAFHTLAKSIGEEMVNPEFVNMECGSSGFVSGDIILEDFTRGERKVKVYSENGDQFSENDLIGNLLYKEDMSLEEQMLQFKYLSEYYNNPQIYQGFLKHYLFHFYLGDEDFHFENIEIFIDENGKSRVSPMFDFSGVFYLYINEMRWSNYGYNYAQHHLTPEFAKHKLVEYIRRENEQFSMKDIEDEFYIKPTIMKKYAGSLYTLKNQKSILSKAISDLEDKQFIENLLNVNIDRCLTDEIYTQELKSIIKTGVSFGKQNIEKAYRLYKEKQIKQFE